MARPVLYFAAFAALALAGCLDENARSYEAFLADLDRLDAQVADAQVADAQVDAGEDTNPSADAAADTATLDADDAATGPDKCSGEAGEAITVTFVNQTSQHADLFWVDAACTEHNLVLIQRGESAQQQTYVHHVFRLKGAFSHDFLGEVEIAAGQTQVIFE